jgi:ribosomal protein S18 acetylase RimI-like enzyme
MMVVVEIREAIEADEASLLKLWNLGEPEAMTLEYWRSVLEVRGVEGFPLRVAGVEDGSVVAFGMLMVPPSAAPGWVQAVVKVEPDRRGAGLGEELWRFLLADPVAAASPMLTGSVRDDDPRSRTWAEERGFVFWAHRFQSVLDVVGFDASPFASATSAVESSGIRLCSVADIASRSDVLDSYFELYRRAVLTTPDNDQGVEPTRDEFDRFYLDPSQHPPQATQLALDDDRVVAMSSLQLRGPGFVYTSMSGVDPEYRGRGLATAVKVRSVAAARELGATRMGTNNLSINAPILAVNDKMGYVRQPGLWLLRRPAPRR